MRPRNPDFEKIRALSPKETLFLPGYTLTKKFPGKKLNLWRFNTNSVRYTARSTVENGVRGLLIVRLADDQILSLCLGIDDVCESILRDIWNMHCRLCYEFCKEPDEQLKKQINAMLRALRCTPIE